MKYLLLLTILGVTFSPAAAQVQITRIEKLPLAKSKEWSNPIFSPDGTLIYCTTSSYQGIWEYNPATKAQRQVVDDPSCGYNFSLSPDGKKIAYRRTRTEGVNRVQEIVVQELSGGTAQVIGSGDNLSTPTFAGTTIVYNDNVTAKNLGALAPQTRPFVLGIENTKIALVISGSKRLLDPLGGGSYIWGEVSPDGQKLVASDMSRGACVSALDGRVLSRLGKRNAATFTRSGKWLIYMKDKDDGHVIQSSDLFCVSPDGKTTRQLTFTKDEIELNPKCSQTKNNIVCNTLDGEIFLMTYEEGRR